jgi:hypothetical protein
LDEDRHHGLTNGAYYTRSEEAAENGIASLQVNDDVEEKSSEDEEEERMGPMLEASDSDILRAFREDESRRNAPLTTENATRVMEAMRGVSFGGVAPDWVGQVPEDQWIDRLRRLRQPPQRTSSSLHNWERVREGFSSLYWLGVFFFSLFKLILFRIGSDFKIWTS